MGPGEPSFRGCGCAEGILRGRLSLVEGLLHVCVLKPRYPALARRQAGDYLWFAEPFGDGEGRGEAARPSSRSAPRASLQACACRSVRTCIALPLNYESTAGQGDDVQDRRASGQSSQGDAGARISSSHHIAATAAGIIVQRSTAAACSFQRQRTRLRTDYSGTAGAVAPSQLSPPAPTHFLIMNPQLNNY
jgi:hypothetical protein